MNDKQPTTVYAVCRDDYEDTGVVAVFTTQALADEHLAQLNRKNAGCFEVMAYDVLDQAPVEAHSYSRSVMMGRASGEMMQHHEYQHGDWDYERPPECVTARFASTGVPAGSPGGWATLHVLAHSAARADMLLFRAVEAAARLRGEGGWPVATGPFDLGVDPANSR